MGAQPPSVETRLTAAPPAGVWCWEDVQVAVRIRLKRVGRRHQPVYRVTAVDGRRPRDGKVLEELGSYDPANAVPERQAILRRERIEYWLSVGAQPSDTVQRLLTKQGIGGSGAPSA